jgi:hypothetical protein
MTDTVMRAAEGAGCSPLTWASGAFSLPDNIVRLWVAKWGTDFVAI